jgi:3-isopropylmalate/(R)-2-methylmalate dehydratase small subunit
VIAPTFADIFFSNAGKNGIVLARLSDAEVETLLQNAQNIPNYQLTVSLEEQTVTDGRGFCAKFEMDPFRKFCLIEGLDDIGLTLRHAAALDSYETKHDEAGWLKAKVVGAD